jgi:hypothetical protein
MFRPASVVAALAVGLWVASARAQGTPWGGDDTGFIPPPADAKCEAGASKAEGKLIACILKCHADRAKGKLADDTAEDSCEKTLAGKSCFAKFAASIAKLKGCPACINGTTMGNLAGLTEGVLDGNNSAIYCGGAPSTTTTSTSTTSTIPPTTTTSTSTTSTTLDCSTLAFLQPCGNAASAGGAPCVCLENVAQSTLVCVIWDSLIGEGQGARCGTQCAGAFQICVNLAGGLCATVCR